MFLCFLFYACIVHPLKSKDKIKELGYAQCMIEGLLDAMSYKCIYLKVSILCYIVSAVFARTALELLSCTIVALLAYFIIWLVYYIVCVLPEKSSFRYDKLHKHPLDSSTQEGAKDSLNKD